MAGEYKAAIDVDKALERPLGELSAAEFLQVLNHPKVRHPSISLFPDKKKYELWVEEGAVVRISLREILEKLRSEKKKVELEILDFLSQRVRPGEVLRRPDVEYAQLVEDIAARVEERLGRS